MAQHHDLVAAGLVFACDEGAAEGCRHAERVEEIRGHVERLEPRGIAGAGERQGGHLRGRDRRVGPGVAAVVEVVGGADRKLPVVEQDHEFPGAGVRQRVQQHGREHGEDRRRRPDAERQREHGRGAESGRAAEGPQGMGQVAEHVTARASGVPAAGTPPGRNQAGFVAVRPPVGIGGRTGRPRVGRWRPAAGQPPAPRRPLKAGNPLPNSWASYRRMLDGFPEPAMLLNAHRQVVVAKTR